MPVVRILLIQLAVLAAATTGAAAQTSIAYEIAFPNAVHHEAEITVEVTGLAPGSLAQMRMSRTSPGRYALHEFAKNVYDVRATDGAGRPLPITRPDLHQWDVAGHDGTVRLRYTLFGDRVDGTYTGIDATHAHLNIPATFLWPRDAWDVPVSLTINRPDSTWRIATQLMPSSRPDVYLAPDLYYFMDSPVEISAFALRTWEVASNGQTLSIRLAVHHAGTDEEVDAYAAMARQVVDEQIALFGEAPDYEGGTYTFIADYLPYADGDGMEHRNSTILSSSSSLEEKAIDLLGTLSHEYFHQWNVERLRPRSLEPFDFEAADVSLALWFAEGFTSYFAGLTLRRAGLTGDSTFAADLSGMLDVVLNAPGSRFYSPAEMSRQAPFVDAATSVDPQNKTNTFISYYTWGAALGLGLDLTLRSRYGKTLDDFMRAAWTRYGKSETPYTLADLQHLLADLTDDPAFVEALFRDHVFGSEMMDYAALLAHAGFLLRKAQAGQPHLGVSLTEDESGRVTISEPTLIGSPAYVAGLDRGDVLLEIDAHPVTGIDDVGAVVAARTPGDTLSLAVEQRGRLLHVDVVLAENPTLEVVPFETADRTPTSAQRSFRARWLSSNVHP